jgi:hypothetical protein
MKSFVTICILAIAGLASGFVSKSAFAPANGLATRASSVSFMTMNAAEKTYIMIKPDGVQVRLRA